MGKGVDRNGVIDVKGVPARVEAWMPQHCKAAAVGCPCDGVESRRRLEQELLRERPGRGRGASLGRFFAGGRGAATSAIDHFGLLWSFGNAGHGPTATHLSKLVDFGRSRDGEEDQRTPESWMIDPPAGFGSAHVVFDAARQAHTFGARPAPALSASCRPKSPKVGRGASDRSKCTRIHTHRWAQRPQHQHS